MGYEDNIKRRTIHLTALSPIHVKGKDLDYGQGFVRRDNYSAYAIDHTKLGKYLLIKRKLDAYLEEVDYLISRRRFKEFDFQTFLQHHQLYNVDNPETHRELIDAGVFKGIVESTNDKQFIRDGLRRAFIPGSSIKGYIRVACIYDHFKNNSFKRWEDFEKEIRAFDCTLTDRFRSVSVTDSIVLDIQKLKNEEVSIVSRNIKNEIVIPQAKAGEARVIEMFGKIKIEADKLYDVDEKMIKKYSLKSGDLILMYKLDSKQKIVIDLTLKEKHFNSESQTQKIISLNFKDTNEIECFSGETEFDIILNKNHQNPPFSSIKQLLQVIDSFSRKIWALEAKYLSEITENIDSISNIKSFYSQPLSNATARLGFGTGLISKTPDGILDELMLTSLVNAFFEPKKNPPHLRPKSRRMITINNQAILPLGWVKLELTNE
jgi:CRISPR type III-A-associated RAMP protein Csm5